MTNFIAGTTYQTRFACDHDTIVEVTVIKRTAKMLTFIYNGETKRAKISIYEGVETFFPTGHYSMAPIISADRAVVEEVIELTNISRARFLELAA